MNNYDALMFYLLNRVLMMFNMRMTGDGKVIYIHRIYNYVGTTSKNVHIIRLSDDISTAFEFLKIDYAYYRKQQFKTIFDFTNYLITNCNYITKDLLETIHEEAMASEPKTDIHTSIDKMVKVLKLGHFVLQDFDFMPMRMYDNLREQTIRSFYRGREVDEQFIALKLRYQKETELLNKFSGKKITIWLPELQNKPELTGIFSQSFVNHATEGEMKTFPRYLIDNDVNVIRKEVISFYSEIFKKSENYLNYILDSKENGIKK